VDGAIKLSSRAHLVDNICQLDYVMRSLAKDQKNRAIELFSQVLASVVLGLQEIKGEGGITLLRMKNQHI